MDQIPEVFERAHNSLSPKQMVLVCASLNTKELLLGLGNKLSLNFPWLEKTEKKSD